MDKGCMMDSAVVCHIVVHGKALHGSTKPSGKAPMNIAGERTLSLNAAVWERALF